MINKKKEDKNSPQETKQEDKEPKISVTKSGKQEDKEPKISVTKSGRQGDKEPKISVTKSGKQEDPKKQARQENDEKKYTTRR